MKLKDWLSKEGLSVTDFARRLNKPQPTVLRYVNGDRIPEPPAMRLIGELTNGEVTANDFYGMAPSLAPEGEAVPAPDGVQSCTTAGRANGINFMWAAYRQKEGS